MLADLRGAFRSVVRHPTFSALVCSILTLGIGATTLAFGIDAVAFINTWIQHPERLGWIFGVGTRHANDRGAVSLADFLDIRERTHAFASLGARTNTTLTLTGRGQASRLGAWQGITADPYDPLVYAGSVLLVLISATVALIEPAVRARSVQVADVLRAS